MMTPTPPACLHIYIYIYIYILDSHIAPDGAGEVVQGTVPSSVVTPKADTKVRTEQNRFPRTLRHSRPQFPLNCLAFSRGNVVTPREDAEVRTEQNQFASSAPALQTSSSFEFISDFAWQCSDSKGRCGSQNRAESICIERAGTPDLSFLRIS